MPTFITDAELEQIVADALKVSVSLLPTAWERIISGANATAYLAVRGALIQRGFLSDQADSWDRGAEFQRDIGLYFALVRGAGLHSYDDRWVMKLDRRKELESVLVEMAGAPQNPSHDPNAIEFGVCGPLDADTPDRFTLEDVW